MTFRKIITKLLKKPAAVIGLSLLLGFAIIAIFAPLIAPTPEGWSDNQMIPTTSLNAVPLPPSEEHILGTTEGQYDVFYGVVWGTRTAFRIGIGITLLTTLIGLIIGSLSGFFGGWVDEVLMRITEIFQAFPFLLTTIILTSVLKFVYQRGEGGIMITSSKILAFLTFGNRFNEPISNSQMAFLFGLISITMFGWMTIARVTRGNILIVKNYDYALAARTIGAKNPRILFRHLVPNAIFPLLVIATMNIGTFVLTFAALSFLGLGMPEGYADWGQMLSLARNWIPSLAKYYYIAIYPGIAILLFVLSWNLVGDALRDVLDPRLRGTAADLP